MLLGVPSEAKELRRRGWPSPFTLFPSSFWKNNSRSVYLAVDTLPTVLGCQGLRLVAGVTSLAWGCRQWSDLPVWSAGILVSGDRLALSEGAFEILALGT